VPQPAIACQTRWRVDRGREGTTTRPIATFAAGAAFAGVLSLLPVAADAGADDVAQIKAVEDQYAAAVNAKDVDAIMKVYVPSESLVLFDAVPPRQYVGAGAVRKDWEGFLATTKGPLELTVTDLACDADASLGYCRSIQRYTGTDTKDNRSI
jgi:ketosteroid isomerase-like protein